MDEVQAFSRSSSGDTQAVGTVFSTHTLGGKSKMHTAFIFTLFDELACMIELWWWSYKCLLTSCGENSLVSASSPPERRDKGRRHGRGGTETLCAHTCVQVIEEDP